MYPNDHRIAGQQTPFLAPEEGMESHVWTKSLQNRRHFVGGSDARIIMSDDERTALIAHENKLIRRLRFLVELTFATIAQDDSMTLEEAWEHVRALKGAAVAMFPGKDETFDLVYLPRFSRLLAERFRAN